VHLHIGEGPWYRDGGGHGMGGGQRKTLHMDARSRCDVCNMEHIMEMRNSSSIVNDVRHHQHNVNVDAMMKKLCCLQGFLCLTVRLSLSLEFCL
jgi:hypothetical protein